MSSSTWRVLSGYATYQRPPMSMTSWGKWAPLKLIAIVALPHDGPLLTGENHTANRLKEKLRQNPCASLRPLPLAASCTGTIPSWRARRVPATQQKTAPPGRETRPHSAQPNADARRPRQSPHPWRQAPGRRLHRSRRRPYTRGSRVEPACRAATAPTASAPPRLYPTTPRAALPPRPYQCAGSAARPPGNLAPDAGHGAAP